jgi:hypothetical protein
VAVTDAPGGRDTVEQPPEQLRYARWLEFGTRIGLLLLTGLFALYAFGLTTPHVALAKLPEVWSLPLPAYLRATGMPTGWHWLPLAGRGDLAQLVGIALLAGCSLPCLLAMVPLYLRRGDKALAALCIAEVVVVLLAASGLLGGDH